MINLMYGDLAGESYLVTTGGLRPILFIDLVLEGDSIDIVNWERQHHHPRAA